MFKRRLRDTDLEKFCQGMATELAFTNDAYHPDQLKRKGVPFVRAKHRRWVPKGFIPFGDELVEIRQIDDHIAFVGQVGSTKSLQVLASCYAAAHSIPHDVEAIFCLDPKGDFARLPLKKGVKKVIYNPVDPDSPDWDIAADIGLNFDRGLELAAMICPVPPRVSDPFWSQISQALVAAAINLLIYVRGTNWTLADLYCLLSLPPEILAEILAICPVNRPIVAVIFQAKAEATRDGIMMQVLSSVNQFVMAAAHSERAKERIPLVGFRGLWVIHQDAMSRKASTPIIHAQFRTLVNYSSTPSAKRGKRKIFIFIEEARFLGELPGLIDLLIFCRSHGIVVVLVMQGVENLPRLYGKEDAETVLSNCGYLAALRLESASSRNVLAERFGESTGYLNSGNGSYRGGEFSYSGNSQYTRVKNVEPSDFLRLPKPNERDGVIGYYKNPNQPEVGRKVHIEGRTLDALTPKLLPLKERKIKLLGHQRPRPWGEREIEQIRLEGRQRRNRQRMEPKSPFGVAPLSDWERALAASSLELTAALIERAIEDAIARGDL